MSLDVAAQSDPWAPGVRASDVPIDRLSAEPIPNKADISAHLYTLFSPSFVQPHPEAWIEIAFGNPAAGGGVNAARTFSAFQLAEAVEFAETQNKAGLNIYVGPALREGQQPSGGRAKDEHAVTSSHAWAEYDGAGDEERIEAILNEHGLKPALVVTTGTVPHLRAHLYFKLDGVVTPEQLKAVNTSLMGLLGSDAVHNNGRVMRLAGTVNYPPPKKRERGYVAELVKLLALPNARSYQPGELIKLTSTERAASDEHGTNASRDDSELRALLEASRIAGRWHTSMRDAIATMIGRGWPDAAIKMSCAPYCTGGAADPDLVPLIQGARGKWDKPDPDRGGNDRHDEAPQTAAELGIWDAGAKPLRPSPRGWLLGNQFCRGFLSTIEAAGATGKTAVRMLQMLSMTTLRELTGEHVFKRCRVLAISFEDGKEEQERRLLAAQLHHNIAPEDIKGWLYCWTPKGIKLAQLDKEGSPARGKLEKMLRDVIAELQIDFVSLDPFIKLHALAENDNGAMDFVTDLLVQIAIDCQVGVDAPHHTKKGLQTAGDADAGRGASARRDAARLGYTLTRMTEEDAKAFGIPAEQCKLYVRLDSGKVNIAPPSEKATWFKLVGVPLDNGNDDYPAGDNVQTVERWYPPETWGGVTTAQLNAALTDIDAGLDNGQRFSDAGPATSRAAWPVVQRHAPDRTEAQCREIVRTWVRNGVLFNEDYDDPIERKSRKGLRVCNGKRPT